MSAPRILLIDDELAVHQGVEFSLRGIAEVTSCTSAETALEKLRTGKYDAALVDVNLGDGLSGTRLVSQIGEHDPDLAAIIFTAHSDYRTAFEALRAHSYDFVPKSLRDDNELRLKVNQAVARTREQRDRSRCIAEAVKLRSALTDTCIDNELEVTNSDIQRGLLGESLRSFTALLGRVEMMDVLIKQSGAAIPELAGLLRFSEETVNELQDYVGKLRDYFAEPERAANSINEILSRAVRIVREDIAERGCLQRVECGELKPDQQLTADGRALLRSVVILTRLLLKTAAKDASVSVKAFLVLNPLTELKMLKARPNSRILQTPDFKKDDKTAVMISISGPSGGSNAEEESRLFSPVGVLQSGASLWSAVAMIARLNGALIVASEASSLRYRIMIRI